MSMPTSWRAVSLYLLPSSRLDWSPPTQKARSPAPVRMTTPQPRSRQAAWKASISSSTVWALKALSLSGRLIVIVTMPVSSRS